MSNWLSGSNNSIRPPQMSLVSPVPRHRFPSLLALLGPKLMFIKRKILKKPQEQMASFRQDT